MWPWLARLLTGRTRAQQSGNEPDIEHDPAQVDAKPAAGAENGTYVGRAAADESGDTGTSGAEARAQARRSRR